MKKLILILSVVVLVSCEADFSPNDSWRDVPIVYCILDQDDDTTYVRLQRCFLGEGDQRQYASVPDSNYYPVGSVTVLMEEWTTWKDNDGRRHRYGNTPARVYNFSYGHLNGKPEGIFSGGSQPIYYYPTGGMLDTTCLYCLKVIKNATGDTIAKAETLLINGNMTLYKPNNVTLFNFSGSTKTCEITWSSLNEARQYQPLVRFWYRDFIIDTTVIPQDTTIRVKSIDIPCNVVKSNMRDISYTTKIEQQYFLSTIQQALIGDSCNKNVIDTIDMFVYCCTEDLAAYLYANNPSGSFNQDPFVYTNIDGGLGVFAARRHHISFRVGTPLSSASDYIRKLKELNVGF